MTADSLKLHIGIDDTDSTKAGCTTHLAYQIVKDLLALGVQFLDYPNLVRLNPNIPYKTRGNGAVALRIDTPDEMLGDVVEVVLRHVEHGAEIGEPGTDPGVVFLMGQLPKVVREFSERLLVDVVGLEDGIRLIKEIHAEAFGYGTKLGLLGALGAVGNELLGDHTFEVIAYRSTKNIGTRRKIDVASVFEMDRKTSSLTFNNVDPKDRRILITPHGPDPVLCGIRGETSETVYQAFRQIRFHEEVAGWLIFRTNHGTDAHLKEARNATKLAPNRPIVLEGSVAGTPKVLRGGHIVFKLRADNKLIDCAAFAPTGELAQAARLLVDGDQVEVSGGTRLRPCGLTVNLEKLRILHLAEHARLGNPSCPQCGKRMKSAGRNQGFRCERCGLHDRELAKLSEPLRRPLSNQTYFPRPKAMRHLTKPSQRNGIRLGWDYREPDPMLLCA